MTNPPGPLLGIHTCTASATSAAIGTAMSAATVRNRGSARRGVADRFGAISPATSDGISILCWDNARFVNHSCEPNCLTGGFDFEFAIRDIAVLRVAAACFPFLLIRRRVIRPPDASE